MRSAQKTNKTKIHRKALTLKEVTIVEDVYEAPLRIYKIWQTEIQRSPGQYSLTCYRNSRDAPDWCSVTLRFHAHMETGPGIIDVLPWCQFHSLIMKTSMISFGLSKHQQLARGNPPPPCRIQHMLKNYSFYPAKSVQQMNCQYSTLQTKSRPTPQIWEQIKVEKTKTVPKTTVTSRKRYYTCSNNTMRLWSRCI